MREFFIEPRRALLLSLIVGVGSLTVGDSVHTPARNAAAYVEYDFAPIPGDQTDNSAGIAVKLTNPEPLTAEQAEILAANGIEAFSGYLTPAQGFRIQGHILGIQCESIVDPGTSAGEKPYTNTSFITDCVVEFGNNTSL